MALARDLMLVGGGRLASALLALISIRLVTTFLSPEQYGELALLITVQMFCGLFLVNPVGQHINLHTHTWWDEGTLLERLKSYRNYVLVVSIVGGCVAFCTSNRHSLGQMSWAALAVSFMVAAGTWNATLIPMLNMLGFRAASVLWSIITVIVGLASSILLIMWLPSAAAWFSGQAIGMGCGALGARYVLRQHSTETTSPQNTLPLLNKKTVFEYCLPLALATGLMWLQLSGYRFLIEGYWGLAQLGFLAVGLQLAGQIWALAESLAMQFLYPLFYRRIGANELRSEMQLAVSDLLNTLVPVYLVLAGLTILSAPYVLRLLVAPQFRGALVFVMLGAGIELCRVLGNLLSNAAHARRNTKSLAFPYAVGAIVALASIYFSGALKMEVGWAGVGLMVGAIAMFITMLISMYRQVKFQLDFLRCLAGATVMLAMALLVIWMPAVSGFGETIGMAMLSATPAVFSVFALLWKNPATLRLLNVQLRKG